MTETASDLPELAEESSEEAKSGAISSNEKKRAIDDSASSKESKCSAGKKRAKAGCSTRPTKVRKERPKKELTGPVLDKPEYYFQSGLRKVRPYWFRHVSFVKQRWYGRTLEDVFRDEMHTKDPEHIKQQIKLGRLTVNDQSSTLDYILMNNDVVKNVIHKHEMPVLEKEIRVVHEDDNVLVVDKPCSIPVHPCGRYYFNSLTYLLQHQFGYDGLRVSHRLDRLTSGLVIFSRTLSKAQELFTLLAERNVAKEYICRVDGEFPDGEVTCDQPISPIYRKMGIRGVSASGQPSSTQFEKIFSEGNQSVVRCIPKTGRTHQIRVHLQYLGYPIVNDYIYNSHVFGPEKGKGGEYGKSKEQLCDDMANAFGAEAWVEDFEESLAAFMEKRPDVEQDQSAKLDQSSPFYDPYCADCHMKSRDPTMEQLEMFLHCLKYEGPNWSYSTAMPNWAVPGWRKFQSDS